jgi:hypothetical protein
MKRIILLFTALLVGFYVSAQISNFEYFFDNDPGVGKGTLVNKFFEGTGQFDISTTGLIPGFHNLVIRAKRADGKWSISENRPFYIMQQITKEPAPKIVLLSYSFDTFGGFGTETIINVDPVSAINKEYSLPYSNLAKGNHILYMRAKDSKGVWSMAESKTFKVDDNVNGINDEFISTFTCYPNPSKGIFILNGFNQNENCKIEVFTLNGKLIYLRQNVNSQTEVDISNETNGVYLLKVTSNEKAITKKIILNRSIN